MNQDQYTIGNLFEQTGCISQDTLLKYADGLLSKSEARKVELHLVDCAFCDAALEGVQAVGTKSFTQMVTRVEERVQAHENAATADAEEDNVIQFRPTINAPAAKSNNKRFVTYFSIAASIVLLAVVGFIFLGGSNAGNVADSYFQEHSISDRRAIMSAKPDAPTSTPADEKAQKALDAYANKDYKTAGPLFDALGTTSSTFQAGNCYYLSGQFDLALARFQEVSGTKSTWKSYADMNLAMTFLKLDRVAEAKTALEQIVAQPNHDFFKQATKALEEVNGL